MADYATLKAAIQAVIYENGNQEITGSVMQATLLAMVNSLGANYQYAGIATPSTNPGMPDQNVFYLASTAGTYVNFGNIALAENEVAILKYNGSWTKELTGFASAEEINKLNGIISGFGFTSGKYLNSSGAEITDNDWNISDYIPYTPGNAVTWKWGVAGSVQSGRCICFYRADKSYISNGYWSTSGSTGQKTISATGIASDAPNAAFVRASYKPNQGANITIGDTVVWKEDGGILGEIQQIKDDIDEINSRLSIQEQNVPQGAISVLAGNYINANGSLSSFNGYKCDVYDVENITKVYLNLTKGQNLASRQYAFYTVKEGFAAANSLLVGPVVNNDLSSGISEVNVPQGAKALLVVNYQSIVTQEVAGDTNVFVDELIKDLIQDSTKDLAIVNKEGNLFIAYLKNGIEYCFWFKRCLANDLYSFYLVGYRTTIRQTPNAYGINEDSVTQINRASSDNIGPVSMSVGGYVGGNHLYDGSIKTAKTDSVVIYVDGKEIPDNFEGYGTKVGIKVINTVYDPSVTPPSGATILTTPLYTETVDYLVEKNNIEVSVNLQFVANAPNRLSNYYGMQSSFVAETGILTPNGKLASGFSLSSSDSFTKGDYPKFNRFIEKKTGAYQATYLIPNKAGNHSMIEDTDNIFSRGNTKDYHHIAIGGLVAGRKITWSGVYTFFVNAIADDADILAYSGVVNGKDAIFISTKQACSVYVPMPNEFMFKHLDFIEKEGLIDTDNICVDADGIFIEATGTGSIIALL